MTEADGNRSETRAHRELKQLALEWAAAQRFRLAAPEVRVPRSNYRADVAAATPDVLSAAAATAIFECKASRADFRRDSAQETETHHAVRELARRLAELRRLIVEHRPDLRRGEELFPEWDSIDLRGTRHETYEALAADLAAAQRRLLEGTKFARLCRWRAATFHYLVAEENLFGEWEVPVGWGLLLRRGDTLVLTVPPRRHETSAVERVAFLERIAAVGARGRAAQRKLPRTVAPSIAPSSSAAA